jgi:hypothetical protein
MSYKIIVVVIIQRILYHTIPYSKPACIVVRAESRFCRCWDLYCGVNMREENMGVWGKLALSTAY